MVSANMIVAKADDPAYLDRLLATFKGEDNTGLQLGGSYKYFLISNLIR